MICLTVTDHICDKWQQVCSTCRTFISRVIGRVPLVEQERPTLGNFGGIRVAQSLVCVWYCADRRLFFSYWPLYCQSSDLLILVTYFSLFKHFLIKMMLSYLMADLWHLTKHGYSFVLLWSACSVDDSPMNLEPSNIHYAVVILWIWLITYSSCQ